MLTWLRRLNQSKILPAFLDRPIVVTFIGGVLLALITTGWQVREKKREIELEYKRSVAKEQIHLLQELTGNYQKAAEAISGRFARSVWIAEETNKPKSRQTTANIENWQQDIRRLEEQYSNAEPLEGVVTRIQVLYGCESVRKTASKLLTDWEAFLKTFEEFIREKNDKERLDRSQIQAAEAKRQEILHGLNTMTQQLLNEMAEELSYVRDGPNKCPA